MKIYLACGLTHVPRELFVEHCEFVHSLARRLRLSPAAHEVKYALVNSDPGLAEKPFKERAKLCYLWDRQMVEEAELVIAEASFPAIGMGIELQIAEAHGTPIILCFRDYHGNRATPVGYTNPDHSVHTLQIGEGFVSLMALGVPTVHSVVQYANIEDGIHKVVDAIALLSH